MKKLIACYYSNGKVVLKDKLLATDSNIDGELDNVKNWMKQGRADAVMIVVLE